MIMCERPIGVFDSGVGGLTVVNEIKKLLPNESIVYFGDTARIPYGTRSPEVIRKYALQDCNFLSKKDVKAIVVACGTVSSSALDILCSDFTLPIIGVVEGAAKKAAELATNGGGNVLVLGTSATVNSGAFERSIHKYNPDINVFSKACPMFVPLVENGYTEDSNPLALLVANEYLSPYIALKPDVVILGCTHYPLLSGVISNILKTSILINSGYEAAAHLKSVLTAKEMLKKGSTAEYKFYVSDDAGSFKKNMRLFSEFEEGCNVSQIELN